MPNADSGKGLHKFMQTYLDFWQSLQKCPADRWQVVDTFHRKKSKGGRWLTLFIEKSQKVAKVCTFHRKKSKGGRWLTLFIGKSQKVAKVCKKSTFDQTS